MVEIILIVLYGVFVRFDKSVDVSNNADRYPAYQDVCVMMLIGFGYLMADSKTTSWSAFSYTFFMNALCMQLYILLNGFWHRVFKGGWDDHFIYIKEQTFTLALYSAASMFVNIGCTIGRVGPLEILIMVLFHAVGYAINEVIVYELIKTIDVGGSSAIHAFGAYSGLTISFILGKFVKPQHKPYTNYTSNIIAFLGTLFLWMYWPSFNFGVFGSTPFQKTQIISNTILALTGSCLGTFFTSAFLNRKFKMEHLLNGTLAGGVAIGASASLFFNPGASFATGVAIGVISTLGYEYLTPYLEHKFGLFDTCGVHNLHGIPGVFGIIISAIAAASYNSLNTVDMSGITEAMFPDLAKLQATPFKQGGLQIAGLFCSIGIGIVTALLTGIVLKCVYKFRAGEFFDDMYYFDEAE